MTTPEIKPVTISYKDFISGKDFTDDISKAFGKTGLGLIAIRDVPDFQEERTAALRAIRKFANLPEEIKDKYTDAKSHYSNGWSHGKERMRSGKPDTAKGSYYANVAGDTEDQSLKDNFPEVYADNIWPRDVVPELETTFMNMARLQVGVGYMVCELLDRYLHWMTGGEHQPGRFLKMLKRKGAVYKGRFLHYFPAPPSVNKTEDGLCGWHLDHGAITVLTCPMYFDMAGNEIPAPPDCGLHIKYPVDGSIVKVTVPSDCLLIQLGESFQFLSGGHLKATAHCVKSSQTPNITRETLVVFMNWMGEEAMKLPDYSLPHSEVVDIPYLPAGVPELHDRIKGAAQYRDFVANTVRAYHTDK